jgi:hypothetical protein
MEALNKRRHCRTRETSVEVVGEILDPAGHAWKMNIDCTTTLAPWDATKASEILERDERRNPRSWHDDGDVGVGGGRITHPLYP